ncbi:MAG: Bug family tripartite tricarboxylate transporter substrate binding protein, partial [Burkholderiales bacterium]
VHPSVPAKTLKQFIELARAKPGVLNYGSGGAGTTNHLANELLKYLEKINVVHVPYKGATLATVAAISGEVDQTIVSVASVLPLIKQGRVRPLVVLSEKRVHNLPDVPTSTEAGFPNFKMSIWYAMFVPAGTPRDILEKLRGEVVKAVAVETLRDRFDKLGIPLVASASLDEYNAFIRKNVEDFAKLAKTAGIKAN